MLKKLKYDGKDVTKDIDRNTNLRTPEEIEAFVRSKFLKNDDRMIVVKKGTEARPLGQYPKGKPIQGEELELKSIPGGTIKGAASNREQTIKAQVSDLASVLGERYGQTVQLDANFRFVVVPTFRLPRRWGLRSTPILLWFPSAYPQVPPHGFYLSDRCRGPHIFSINVYGDSPDLSAYGWNWYCVNPSGWAPGSSPLTPDNLWTLLDVVRATLTVDEF